MIFISITKHSAELAEVSKYAHEQHMVPTQDFCWPILLKWETSKIKSTHIDNNYPKAWKAKDADRHEIRHADKSLLNLFEKRFIHPPAANKGKGFCCSLLSWYFPQNDPVIWKMICIMISERSLVRRSVAMLDDREWTLQTCATCPPDTRHQPRQHY